MWAYIGSARAGSYAVNVAAGAPDRAAKALVAAEHLLDVVVAREDPGVELLAPERRKVVAKALVEIVSVVPRVAVDDRVELVDQIVT